MNSESTDSLFFVYRTHYEGPLSKRIQRLPDPSVLHWFQRGWRAAAAGEDCDEWVKAELGGKVYGLDSIFRAVQEENLKLPETWQELRDLLYEHLYVEGDEENIQMDAHSLRVKTDDDEVDLAYFFFDAALAREQPDRIAYLLHEGWELPDGVGEGGFVPAMPVRPMEPAGTGKGETYCVLLTFYASESFATEPRRFTGVRLPELAAYLRNVIPHSIHHVEETGYKWEESWPYELLALRSLLEPDDTDLSEGLKRCNEWPAADIDLSSQDDRIGARDYAEAHTAALELRVTHPGKTKRDPARTLIKHTTHLAQMCIHMNDFFGYQQWFIFDDLWASAHPDLAQSLLWYAYSWDILQEGNDPISP